MKRRWIESAVTQRVILVVVSVSITLVGVRALLGGDFSYKNYFGGLVFAPIAVIAGIVGILVAGPCWHRTQGEPKKLKGRAARKARQADRYRSAVDDFDRPWRGGY